MKSLSTSLRSLLKCSNKNNKLWNLVSKKFNFLVDNEFLTEDQKNIQEAAYNFAKNELFPNAAEWDQKKHFPKDVYRKSAELGFAGIYTSETYGGSNLGRLEASLIFEGLATGCVGSSAYLSIHNMCCWMIDEFGSEEQKKSWLPKMTNLEWFSSYCLTEPGSGSDAMAMVTKAEEDGEDYIINGSKAFISGNSDIFLVMCKTGEKEISCIAVERTSKGLSLGKNEHKMGWNVQPTQMVLFDNVRVPKKNLIGKRGNGFKIAMMGLDGGRINIASCSLGGAAYCLDAAKEYMKTRKQFGKPISDFQYLQFKMAEMATDLQVSRIIVRQAAQSIDQKSPNKTIYASMAKLTATEKCFDIVSGSLQMHGGYGYLKEYPIERYFRDLRVHMILEGTNEIMRMIIARKIFQA